MKSRTLIWSIYIRLMLVLSGYIFNGCQVVYTDILSRKEAERNPDEVSSIFLKDSTEIRFDGGVNFDYRPIGIRGTTTEGIDTLIAWEGIAELQVSVPDPVSFSPDKVHLFKEVHLKNKMAVRPDKYGFFFDPLSGYINGKTENGLLIKLHKDNIAEYFTELPATVTKNQMFADTTIQIQRVMLSPDNILVSFSGKGAGLSPTVNLLTGIELKKKNLFLMEAKDIAYFTADRLSIKGVAQNVALVAAVIAAVIGLNKVFPNYQ